MASQPNVFYSPDEYLEIESRSEVKHEYLDGDVFDREVAG